MEVSHHAHLSDVSKRTCIYFSTYSVYIFLNLFVLLECALMLMTSTTEAYF